MTNKGNHRFVELLAVKVDGPLFPAPDNESLTTALADGVAPLSFSCVGQSFVAPWNVPVAPSYAPPLIFVALCSGIRREEDPQWFMERQAAEAGLPVLCVSLDIAMDDVRGDVLSSLVKNQLIDWAMSGRLIGIIMGPPCETWTVARFLAILDMLFPPRPLRSATTPTGLPDISSRELAQVHVGDDFLLLALFAFLLGDAYWWYSAFVTSVGPSCKGKGISFHMAIRHHGQDDRSCGSHCVR